MSGHTFFYVSPSHRRPSWVYDITTGLWHEWAWIDVNGNEHRHRANCFWPVDGKTLVVGDWQNGNLYALDSQLYTDNGHPIKRARSFPHSLNSGKRVFYRQFLADMDVGNAPELPVEYIITPPTDPAGFFALPRIAGGGHQGFANGISANGHTAVGWVSPPTDDSFQIACYWTSASGKWNDITGPVTITNPDPAVGDFAEARGASGDGSSIVGVVQQSGGFFPFRWTAAAGLVVFGTISGQAQAVSADGSRIAGYVQPGLPTDSHEHACYWDSSSLTRTDVGFLPA
jgi:hypothetical protein